MFVVDQAISLGNLEERQKKDIYDLEVSHVKGRFVLQLHNLLSRNDQVHTRVTADFIAKASFNL